MTTTNEIDKLKIKLDSAKKLFDATKDDCNTLQNKITGIEQCLEHIKEREDICTQIEVLKGQIEILKQRPVRTDFDTSTKKIANAVVQITKKQFDDSLQTLLKKISKCLVNYANTFGISQLEDAELRANANLPIVKGGIPTSYSKVTDGQKLRLKVALTLAMLKVAEDNGVGCHPGLLIIDSPKAQEMAETDFEALIKGINEISQELPFMQIFIAGRSSDILLDSIPQSHRITAMDTSYLW